MPSGAILDLDDPDVEVEANFLHKAVFHRLLGDRSGRRLGKYAVGRPALVVGGLRRRREQQRVAVEQRQLDENGPRLFRPSPSHGAKIVARSRAVYRPGASLGRQVAVRSRPVRRRPKASVAAGRVPPSGRRSTRTRTRRGLPAIRYWIVSGAPGAIAAGVTVKVVAVTFGAGTYSAPPVCAEAGAAATRTATIVRSADG